MEKHLIELESSTQVEVRIFDRAEGEEDEVWVGKGSVIFTVDEWKEVVKFVERVRNF